MPEDISIGQLRWPVVIARRVQSPDAMNTGVAESLQHVLATRARIDPVGANQYYGSAAVDTPFTHKVWIRYVSWLDTRHVIIRATQNPGDDVRDTYNTELFRVRRWSPWAGRKRYLYIEAEEERRVESELDPAGADAPRSPNALDLYDAADTGALPSVPGTGGVPPAAPAPGPWGTPYASPFVFEQRAPAAVWTIPHAFGRRPVVETYDDADREVAGDERHPDERTVVIRFSRPVAGRAYLT